MWYENFKFWIKIELNKLKENTMMNVAWMLPNWLVYFVAIRFIAHATTNKYGQTVVPKITAMDALARWGSDKYPGKVKTSKEGRL